MPATRGKIRADIIIKTHQQQEAINLVADYLFSKEIAELAREMLCLVGAISNLEGVFTKEAYDLRLYEQTGNNLPNFILLN